MLHPESGWKEQFREIETRTADERTGFRCSHFASGKEQESRLRLRTTLILNAPRTVISRFLLHGELMYAHQATRRRCETHEAYLGDIRTENCEGIEVEARSLPGVRYFVEAFAAVIEAFHKECSLLRPRRMS